MLKIIGAVAAIVAFCVAMISLFRALRPVAARKKSVRVKIGDHLVLLSRDTRPDEIDEMLSESNGDRAHSTACAR
jgi:hypothetical protein